MGDQNQENQERILSVRLQLAAAWIKFYHYAYDVLQSHGICFKKLPEYQDKDKLLDASLDRRGTLEAGAEKITLYIERLTNALTAAVRRKSLRPV